MAERPGPDEGVPPRVARLYRAWLGGWFPASFPADALSEAAEVFAEVLNDRRRQGHFAGMAYVVRSFSLAPSMNRGAAIRQDNAQAHPGPERMD